MVELAQPNGQQMAGIPSSSNSQVTGFRAWFEGPYSTAQWLQPAVSVSLTVNGH
jgi:hypothetical protein